MKLSMHNNSLLRDKEYLGTARRDHLICTGLEWEGRLDGWSLQSESGMLRVRAIV